MSLLLEAHGTRQETPWTGHQSITGHKEEDTLDRAPVHHRTQRRGYPGQDTSPPQDTRKRRPWTGHQPTTSSQTYSADTFIQNNMQSRKQGQPAPRAIGVKAHGPNSDITLSTTGFDLTTWRSEPHAAPHQPIHPPTGANWSAWRIRRNSAPSESPCCLTYNRLELYHERFQWIYIIKWFEPLMWFHIIQTFRPELSVSPANPWIIFKFTGVFPLLDKGHSCIGRNDDCMEGPFTLQSTQELDLCP